MKNIKTVMSFAHQVAGTDYPNATEEDKMVIAAIAVDMNHIEEALEKSCDRRKDFAEGFLDPLVITSNLKSENFAERMHLLRTVERTLRMLRPALARVELDLYHERKKDNASE